MTDKINSYVLIFLYNGFSKGTTVKRSTTSSSSPFFFSLRYESPLNLRLPFLAICLFSYILYHIPLLFLLLSFSFYSPISHCIPENFNPTGPSIGKSSWVSLLYLIYILTFLTRSLLSFVFPGSRLYSKTQRSLPFLQSHLFILIHYSSDRLLFNLSPPPMI